MLTGLRKIKENDNRGVTNSGVMAGEVQTAGFAIHTKYGDVVASLIAAITHLFRALFPRRNVNRPSGLSPRGTATARLRAI
jgi:hypothetical protein